MEGLGQSWESGATSSPVDHRPDSGFKHFSADLPMVFISWCYTIARL